MKAIVKVEPREGAQLMNVADPPSPVSDQVLVKVKATSICGTDYHIHSWDAWSSRRVKPPRIMGHEFAGTVVAIGPEVSRARVGDYVSGESHWVCGLCLQCRSGQKHVCENTRILGVDVDGCFAEYVTVPEGSSWPNDPSVPAEIACIQDPLGNAIHAALAGEIIGRSVAVLGCGPIGIFAVAVARACGARRVFATDAKPYRLALAEKLGADAVFDVTTGDAGAFFSKVTNGLGVDVVLEMSGAVSAIRQAMEIARPGGRVSLMGIPTAEVSLDISSMIFKGLDVQCIVGRRLYETWDTMKGLLTGGRLDVAPVITHRLGFDEYDRGMALMRDGLCGKVVFEL